MRLSEALQRLCVATRANGRAQRTVESYRKKIGRMIDFLGDVEVDTVTVHDLRRWIAHLMDSDLSPFTVETRARHVRRLFNFLIEEGELDDNPMDRIQTPRPRRKKPKGIHSDDLQALLEDTEGEELINLRDRALILFLADTGCRVGGLCGLKLADLDLDACTSVVTEKGGKVRTVIFTEPTAEALRKWIQAADIEGPVFAGLGARSNGGLTPSGVLQVLTRHGERVGAKGPVNPHAFRHGFARHYLLDGGDLGTLSDLLGHEDVSVTKAFYGVFLLQELKAKHHEHSPVRALFGGNGHE